MEKMNVEYWKIDDVKPYENNPRINDGAVEATANSIKQFGWKQPIVVDKEGVIIVGHTRLKAAKKLGMEEVPVLVAKDLTFEQADAYRLADNKTGEISEWDMDMLGDELSQIEDIDMTDFGFDDEDLELQDENTDAKEDDEFEEEIPEKPKSKVGDIYQLGRHRLMCGDSTDEKQVETLMGGQKADLLITDPPYNINYSRGVNELSKIKNDNEDEQTFTSFLEDTFSSAMKVLKPGASAYIWFSSMMSVPFYSALQAAGFKAHQQLIWNKNNIALGKPYRNKYEPCIFATINGKYNWYSDNSQTTVLNFDRPHASKLHPTMKPVPLFNYEIKNSSKAGDLVLDLFGGSGTTMIACEQNGRNSYLMEIDPKYADVIIDRWEEFTGKKAEKLN